MTRFSYSEYLSQFCYGGNKGNTSLSKLSSDEKRCVERRRQNDITSESAEWVFCYLWSPGQSAYQWFYFSCQWLDIWLDVMAIMCACKWKYVIIDDIRPTFFLVVFFIHWNRLHKFSPRGFYSLFKNIKNDFYERTWYHKPASINLDSALSLQVICLPSVVGM